MYSRKKSRVICKHYYYTRLVDQLSSWQTKSNQVWVLEDYLHVRKRTAGASTLVRFSPTSETQRRFTNDMEPHQRYSRLTSHSIYSTGKAADSYAADTATRLREPPVSTWEALQSQRVKAS